jgi:hypothetical protein
MPGVTFVPARLSNVTKRFIAKPSLLPDLPRLLPKVIVPVADTFL